VAQLVSVLTVLAVAPLLNVVIGNLKAKVQSRRGPRRSKATTSPSSSRRSGWVTPNAAIIFRADPYVAFAMGGLELVAVVAATTRIAACHRP